MKRMIIVLMLLTTTVNFAKYQPTWESLDQRECPQWFLDAKFGIFIHWGVYSVPAYRKLSPKKFASYAEWYYCAVIDDEKNGGKAFHRANYGKDFEYRQFAPMFRAELWDPDMWANLFKDAGARYVVLTSKHHDGYCLWPTKVPHKENWNSMDIGPKRDLLGDLTKAVRNAGLKMGLYYSIPDWESVPRKNGKYQINQEAVDKYGVPLETYVKEIHDPQLRELVMNYEPCLIFSDAGEWAYDENFWSTKEFMAWLYNESPVKDEVVVNDRFCKDMPGRHGDYVTSEYANVEVGARPWEENRGIGGSYGYNRAENLHDYQSTKELIYELIDIVSRGGNLLLNVGPTADGRIPVIQQQRLHDIGQWLKVNGEAIYETRKSKRSPIKDENGQILVYFTSKGKDSYAICPTYPEKGFTVTNLTSSKIKVSLLGYEGPVTVKTVNKTTCNVVAPKMYPTEFPCEHAYVFKIENGE